MFCQKIKQNSTKKKKHGEKTLEKNFPSNKINSKKEKKTGMTVEIGSRNVNSKEYKLISQLPLFGKTAFEMFKHILENSFKIWPVLQ